MKNKALTPIEIRIKQVSEMILKGVPYLDILQLSDEWDCTTRTIQNYIAKAKELIIKANETDIKHETAKLKQRYEMLFNLALGNLDLKTCTTILNQQSKMFGIAEPKEDSNDSNSLIITHKFAGAIDTVLPVDSFTDNGSMDLSI